MVSRPPSGIASRAFTHRFSRALSSWLASAQVGQSPPASTVSTRRCSPIVRRSISDMPPTILLASTAAGASGCWREKASRREVSWAARWAPSMALSTQAAAFPWSPVEARIFASVERSHHDGEHVVEVVRDSAGQLADGFHLLHLPRLGFDLFAALSLFQQFSIRLFERVMGRWHLSRCSRMREKAYRPSRQVPIAASISAPTAMKSCHCARARRGKQQAFLLAFHRRDHDADPVHQPLAIFELPDGE